MEVPSLTAISMENMGGCQSGGRKTTKNVWLRRVVNVHLRLERTMTFYLALGSKTSPSIESAQTLDRPHQFILAFTSDQNIYSPGGKVFDRDSTFQG